MSSNYSLHLYFPRRRLFCVVDSLIKLTEHATEQRMSLRLPENQKVVVPYTGQFIPDKQKRDLSYANAAVLFQTTFSLSDCDKTSAHDFYITLATGDAYSALSIQSTALVQNRLIETSTSLHTIAQNMLARCDGLFALLDKNEEQDGIYRRYFLHDPDTAVQIDIIASAWGSNVDYVVDTALEQHETE
ncbi:MAG: hypothetical protein AAFQ07_04535 [Chloroflexota bacterium]